LKRLSGRMEGLDKGVFGMSEEAREAARAAREAMELLRGGRPLTKAEKKRLEKLYAQWRGARDEAWREAEGKIEQTLRLKGKTR
jgi:prophage DNA circulation protein